MDLVDHCQHIHQLLAYAINNIFKLQDWFSFPIEDQNSGVLGRFITSNNDNVRYIDVVALKTVIVRQQVSVLGKS